MSIPIRFFKFGATDPCVDSCMAVKNIRGTKQWRGFAPYQSDHTTSVKYLTMVYTWTAPPNFGSMTATINPLNGQMTVSSDAGFIAWPTGNPLSATDTTLDTFIAASGATFNLTLSNPYTFEELDTLLASMMDLDWGSIAANTSKLVSYNETTGPQFHGFDFVTVSGANGFAVGAPMTPRAPSIGTTGAAPVLSVVTGAISNPDSSIKTLSGSGQLQQTTLRLDGLVGSHCIQRKITKAGVPGAPGASSTYENFVRVCNLDPWIVDLPIGLDFFQTPFPDFSGESIVTLNAQAGASSCEALPP